MNQAQKDRRKQLFRKMLGSVCVQCGSGKNLQFDHINPKEKLFSICTNITKQFTLLIKEIQKCQLLCKLCHHAKCMKNDEYNPKRKK